MLLDDKYVTCEKVEVEKFFAGIRLSIMFSSFLWIALFTVWSGW